ncbi:hypothetical protein CMO91_03575 [Candidatus Woesearchaeota archaeon]|nr:hypothetical protein [Candidatus Woesearchaeota archaeon]
MDDLSKTTAAFYITDVGSLEALQPLFEHFNAIIFADPHGQAYKRMDREQTTPLSRADGLSQIFTDLPPDILVTGTTPHQLANGHYGREASLWDLARAYDVPSVALWDKWDPTEVNSRLEIVAGSTPTPEATGNYTAPDVLLMPSNHATVELTGLITELSLSEFPKLVSTGNPRHDLLKARKETELFSLPVNNIPVLLSSENYMVEHGTSNVTLLSWLTAESLNVFHWLVCYHPKDTAETVDAYRETLGDRGEIVDRDRYDTSHIVRCTPRFVVGTNSTLLEDAIIQGIPALSIQPGFDGDVCDLSRQGVIPRATTPAHMGAALELYSQGSKFVPSMEKYREDIDGGATARVLDEISCLNT